METAAIIVAAGQGRRVGGTLPKQWRDLGGRAVLAWTLDAFRKSPRIDRIVLVLRREDMGLAPGYEAHSDVTVVTGGETRSASVSAGIEALAEKAPHKVLIHDGARPLVSGETIGRVVDALDAWPGAAPALAVTDALWTGDGGLVQEDVNRAGLYRAQTPQGFHYQAIRGAHLSGDGMELDDVAIARAAGIEVAIVEGDERNLKITTEADFARAEALLETTMDIRTGSGFDVHAFGLGDHVTLCGVEVAFEKGLKGHSDADVALHAITDAIYGALAEGDIGTYFPPTDPQWSGAQSRVFLEHAAGRAASRGFDVNHIDCTIICERPKIGPHSETMRSSVAEIIGLDLDRVSIKATTSEKLGFTGREEGIAATAVATLVRR